MVGGRGRDRIAGGALILLGAGMAIVARGFPSIGAMAYGPDLFPTIVGAGLMLSGLGVALEAAPDAPARARSPVRHWGLVAVAAAFALTLDPLGFHVAGGLAAAAAIRLFGGGWALALVLGAVGTALLHALFYSVMRVPLPWGLLLPVAW